MNKLNKSYFFFIQSWSLLYCQICYAAAGSQLVRLNRHTGSEGLFLFFSMQAADCISVGPNSESSKAVTDAPPPCARVTICWKYAGRFPMSSLLESNSFFVLPLPEIMTEDQAPGGHARPSLGVQKLGNNQVDFSVQFVGVFQFKQKSGVSNRHFASLRLCSSCSQLDRYCPYICRCEMFRTEVVAKNKTHVVCPYWELRSSGSLRSA
jgi:hypothetical protein